jgi:hypothetical protein
MLSSLLEASAFDPEGIEQRARDVVSPGQSFHTSSSVFRNGLEHHLAITMRLDKPAAIGHNKLRGHPRSKSHSFGKTLGALELRKIPANYPLLKYQPICERS